MTGCISRFCRLSTRNNYTAGEQRKGNSNVGAACYRCVGIIFDQVDTGTVEGKVGGSGSMLDAVAAGNPVGSKQHRRAAGYRLLGVIDRVQIAGSIWAGIWVRCRSSRRTWARAAAAGAARIEQEVNPNHRKAGHSVPVRSARSRSCSRWRRCRTADWELNCPGSRSCTDCHRKEDSCTDYNRKGMDCSSLGHSMP